MKRFLASILFLLLGSFSFTFSQDQPVAPTVIITGEYLGETPPLRDIPPMTEAEREIMAEKALKRVLNPKPRYREYPYAETALPKGPDPVWQREMGASRDSRAPLLNFEAQTSPYYPPDANGTVGPNHYMQTVNTTYAIYNKSGTQVVAPTALNTLFSGVTGSENNDGDPIVLYDEQADRWLVAEFSISGTNDYMLIAVSTTNDPTGTWHKYSFDVADMPDYEKFGIWRDGYYMGTNNGTGADIYVFERSQMLIGGTAQGVGFDNPFRPKSGFICVPPVDNDGAFAPEGSPGIFIAAYDDAWAGGSDQLWIYELDVDWTTPSNSSFTRTQQINVAPFDANFGISWDNIVQPGTSQKLDAIAEMIMNPPQYRNFGDYQTIVCCHTVDVDATDHAGIRWYELRRTSGDWSVRQQGTFAPDQHSRWLGSIMLNGNNEIGLGYSISSSTVYPGIRYTAQSAASYALANGIMDVPEEIIHTGAYSQTGINRWGDYAGMQLDPVDDQTFWFTSQYIGSGGARRTKIASFSVGPVILNANFFADLTATNLNTTVSFTDQSVGGPISWTWDISPVSYVFVDGTSATSQHPRVQFSAVGSYTVSLTVTDGETEDTEVKTNYITVADCENFEFPLTQDFSTGTLPICWSNIDNQGNGQVWRFDNPGNRSPNTATAANGFAILDSDNYGGSNSQHADLVTPSLNFSGYSSVSLYFQHYFLAYPASSATLLYSTNGGVTWTTLQAWTATTANPAVYNQDLSSQVAGQANVRFCWKYIGSFGWYWVVDDVSITASGPGRWIGGTSGDWATPTNWSDNTVPSSTNNIYIPGSADNWPTFSGDLTLGSTCGDITLDGNSEMTVNGNLTINSGRSLIVPYFGTVNAGGDWVNNGNFSRGSGTVIMTGALPSTVSGGGNASIVNYIRGTFTKGMELLSGATTGPTGNDGYADAPIGFTFNYAGYDYTQIRISTNGWAAFTLSGTTVSENGNLFDSNIPNATLAPWFDNLKDDDVSVVSYKTEGIAPDRVFTIEWKSVVTYQTGGANERISFQVKLFETSHVIEFHYGNVEAGNNSGSESASIGIEDATGGPGHFIEATTGSTTTGVTDLNSTSNWPTVNYRFTPPSSDQVFHHLIINNPGGNVNFNANTQVKGDFNVMPGGAFTVTGGKTLQVEE